MTISIAMHSRPGKMPEMKSAPIDTFDTTARMTMVRLGGITWAIDPAQAISAAPKSTS